MAEVSCGKEGTVIEIVTRAIWGNKGIGAKKLVLTEIGNGGQVDRPINKAGSISQIP